MDFGLGSYLFGFGAGVLSTLSPCALPLIPLLAAAALGAHRFGIAALSLGLAISFTGIGLLVATVGLAVGLNGEEFRLLGAVVMAAIGVILVSPSLQARFAAVGGGVSDVGHRLLDRMRLDGMPGQFVVGLVLGAVWSPCVGPTLGAASLLAAQRQQLVEVAGIMLLFGLGAALPLLLIGSLGRSTLGRWRSRLSHSGHIGKTMLGVVLLLFAVLAGTGLDKDIEARLVAVSPDWLTDLTTRY